MGRITTQELQRIFGDCIPSTCTVVSDSLRSYHKFMKGLNVTWEKIPSGKKEIEGYTLNKVNLLHSAIELFFHKYRGISDKYLRNYIALFKYQRKHPKYYLNKVYLDIFTTIVNSICHLKYEDFNEIFLNFIMDQGV